MAWSGKRGGGWTVYSSYAKAKSRKPNKAEFDAEKLLAPGAMRGYMGGITQMGIACGFCAHFESCQRLKGVSESTNYCQYRPGRFQGKHE